MSVNAYMNTRSVWICWLPPSSWRAFSSLMFFLMPYCFVVYFFSLRERISSSIPRPMNSMTWQSETRSRAGVAAWVNWRELYESLYAEKELTRNIAAATFVIDMASVERLFSQTFLIRFKSSASLEDRKSAINVSVELHSSPPRKELHIQLTDNDDLFFLYSLTLGKTPSPVESLF